MKNDSDEKQYLLDKDFFSSMSAGELGKLGVGDVAYVRRHTVNGKTAFILHAADGTALTAQRNEDMLRSDAQEHDLELVTVH